MNQNNNKPQEPQQTPARQWLAAFNIWANARDVFVRPPQRLPQIDGVRAFSILYVLVFHGLIALVVLLKPDERSIRFLQFVQDTPWYFQWVLMGDRGVDAFFVISGFLIGQLLFQEFNKTGTIDLKRFFMRRWLRLTPVYFLVIALFAVLAGPGIIDSLVQQQGLSEAQAQWRFWGAMAAYVTYLNNFLPFEQGYYIPFAWSLAVEEQFYILFSLFMAFVYVRIRHRLRFLLGLFLLSFVIRWLLFYCNPHLLVTGDVLLAGGKDIVAAYWELIYGNLYSRFGAIMPGIVLAWLSVYRWPAVQQWMTVRRSNMLVLLALATLLVLTVMPVYSGQPLPLWLSYLFHVAHRNLFALALAVLILAALFPYGLGGLLGRLLSLRLFFPVSQLSYSIYLVHLPVLVLCALLLKALGVVDGLAYGPMFVVLALALPLIIAVSLLLYVLVERPFMKLRRG